MLPSPLPCIHIIHPQHQQQQQHIIDSPTTTTAMTPTNTLPLTIPIETITSTTTKTHYNVDNLNNDVIIYETQSFPSKTHVKVATTTIVVKENYSCHHHHHLHHSYILLLMNRLCPLHFRYNHQISMEQSHCTSYITKTKTRSND